MARRVVRALNAEPPAADTWICPNCGTRNVEPFYVCAECSQKKVEQQGGGAQEPGIGTLTEEMLAAETWICTNCGERNVEPFYICAKCGQKKSEQESAGAQESRNEVYRPFGMTLIALYLLIVGGLALIGLAKGLPDGSKAFQVGAVCGSLSGIVRIIAAIGIWQMKKWGMGLAVALSAGVIVLWVGILMLTQALRLAIECPSVNDLIFPLAREALIVSWLVENRELFDRHTWIDPEIIQDQIQSDLKDAR